MMATETEQLFAERALDLLGAVLSGDPRVEHTARTFASVFARAEEDVLDVIRSRYLHLADAEEEFPVDLVRLASLVGLDLEPGMPTEVFRERLRLFVQAYLQGAGTPQSLLTMAAAELGVLPAGPAHRDGSVWIQSVRRLGQPPDVIRLEENPVYRVEKRPVRAKTGSRWTIDNPGGLSEVLVRPQVTIEALVDDVRGPSLVLEDIGMAWLFPDVHLDREEKLVLQVQESGRFSAHKHSDAGLEDVTRDVDLVGSIPDLDELDRGVRLTGGSEEREATAFVKDSATQRMVRFCARAPGIWGNGLTLRRMNSSAGIALVISFDPVLAAAGTHSTEDTERTTWTIDIASDILGESIEHLKPGNFLLAAEDATLFLPLSRSRWMYLDHQAVLGERGDVRNLARMVLDYTRFGRAVHHNLDNFGVYRLDRSETRFGEAVYTIEEEQVEITVSWLQQRPTAIRLEVPAWIEEETDIEARSRLYQRLAAGMRRIKPAGVSASVLRRLPDDGIAVAEVFPDHLTIRTSDCSPAVGYAVLCPRSRQPNRDDRCNAVPGQRAGAGSFCRCGHQCSGRRLGRGCRGGARRAGRRIGHRSGTAHCYRIGCRNIPRHRNDRCGSVQVGNAARGGSSHRGRYYVAGGYRAGPANQSITGRACFVRGQYIGSRGGECPRRVGGSRSDRAGAHGR